MPSGLPDRKRTCLLTGRVYNGENEKGEREMTEEREMKCAGCEKLCNLHLTLKDGELETVSGQGCGTGAEYAARELLMD